MHCIGVVYADDNPLIRGEQLEPTSTPYTPMNRPVTPYPSSLIRPMTRGNYLTDSESIGYCIFSIVYSIISSMAVLFEKRGRPHYVADMDFSTDRDLEFWDKFYSVCADFKYRDIMAVSRAFNITPNTVERWKYKLTFPRKGRAEQVIAWVEAGKPMRLEQPALKTGMI